MNEYIVQLISATRLWLISRLQSSHTDKSAELKMTAKKLRTSMYRVIFVTVLTNKSQAHGLTITDLYAENIVFDTDTDDTHDSCIFDQLIANVCPVTAVPQA